MAIYMVLIIDDWILSSRFFRSSRETLAHIKQVCADNNLSVPTMLSFTHSVAFSGFSARFVKVCNSATDFALLIFSVAVKQCCRAIIS